MLSLLQRFSTFIIFFTKAFFSYFEFTSAVDAHHQHDTHIFPFCLPINFTRLSETSLKSAFSFEFSKQFIKLSNRRNGFLINEISHAM